VKVTSASTNSDYFLHLGQNVIGSVYRGRVFVIKDTGSDNIAFGLSFGSGSASVITPYNYSLNTTYLIGLKYEIVTGEKNDIVKLYINPNLGGSEPSYDLIHTDATVSDPTDIGSIALRQGSSSNNVTAIVDGIRVGLNWNDTSLPVELESFVGELGAAGVKLSWSTASEIENQGFNLYRRILGGEYSLLASYLTEPALRGAGSSSEAHSYSYVDKSVQPGVTYVYQLADVDYAGKETKHKEVEVKVEAERKGLVGDYRLKKAYPNPFNASFTIPLELGVSLPVDVRLYDVSGACVRTIRNEILSAGTYYLTTDTRDLTSGIYLLRMRVGNQTETQKIVLMK